MFWLSLVILLHSICRLYCKASVFDRRIVERLWKGASDCERLIFINCQFLCILKEIPNFQQDLSKWSVVLFSDMFVCCAASLCFHFLFVITLFEVALCCIVVLSSVLCSSACFVLQWFFPSARSLSHPYFLLTSFRLVLAWPCLALICYVLFCSCRFRLLLRVAFSLRFLRVVFCKSLLLSRRSALRVSPAETRLTVYRRLSILLCSDRPSSGVHEDW